MLKERLLELFRKYDADVQEVIAEVVTLEQEHISMKNPRGIKEKIKEVIDRVAKDET